MKKFIKELEDRGIMKEMVDSAIITEKITGCPVNQDGMELVLGFHMGFEEDLEDLFVEESNAIAMNSVFKYFQKLITERQKVEALNDVDFDALFAKVKELTSSKKVEPENLWKKDLKKCS